MHLFNRVVIFFKYFYDHLYQAIFVKITFFLHVCGKDFHTFHYIIMQKPCQLWANLGMKRCQIVHFIDKFTDFKYNINVILIKLKEELLWVVSVLH